MSIQEIREYSPLGSILEAAGAFLESYAKTRAMKEAEAAEQNMAREQMDLRRWETTTGVDLAREQAKHAMDLADKQHRAALETEKRRSQRELMEMLARGALTQQEFGLRKQQIEAEHTARMAEIAASKAGGGGSGRWEPQSEEEWLRTHGRDKGGAVTPRTPDQAFDSYLATLLGSADPAAQNEGNLLLAARTAAVIEEQSTPGSLSSFYAAWANKFKAPPAGTPEPEKTTFRGVKPGPDLYDIPPPRANAISALGPYSGPVELGLRFGKEQYLIQEAIKRKRQAALADTTGAR